MCLETVSEDASGKSGAPQEGLLRVAVAGLGVVGEGAALRLIDEASTYDFCAALVRDLSKSRDDALSETPIVGAPEELLADNPDVVIDALPSGEAGRELISLALSRGIHVTTANKQAIAGHMAELSQLAAEHGALFTYAASVGGGAPIVETVRRARAEGEIASITAILNGTVNFILSELAKGGAFWDAVKLAQDAGFAEPDPSADLSGEDARAKISILSYEAFGEEIDLKAIKVEPLDETRAAEFAKGGAWKQLARLTRSPDGGVTARVAFEAVDDDPDLKDVTGEGNAAKVITESGRVFTCQGKGAGRLPTVSSLFADLVAIRNAKDTLPPRQKSF